MGGHGGRAVDRAVLARLDVVLARVPVVWRTARRGGDEGEQGAQGGNGEEGTRAHCCVWQERHASSISSCLGWRGTTGWKRARVLRGVTYDAKDEGSPRE